MWLLKSKLSTFPKHIQCLIMVFVDNGLINFSKSNSITNFLFCECKWCGDDTES